jgi:hypothetical protein
MKVKGWRLRFVVMPRAQLRANFPVVSITYDVTGQSPLPLPASPQSLTDGVRGGRRRWIRGRRKHPDEFDGDQSEKHEQINS